jgi:hypothetical protein
MCLWNAVSVLDAQALTLFSKAEAELVLDFMGRDAKQKGRQSALSINQNCC